MSWSAALLAALLAALAGCSLFLPTGTVTGTVVQAASPATPIAGVGVTVAGTTDWTDTAADGTFSVAAPVSAPGGSATLRFDKPGCIFADAAVMVAAKSGVVSPGEQLVGYPQLTPGQYRFVLTWGAAPADLDAYLSMPLDPGTDVVWSGNTPGGDGSASFELGGTTGFGPETIVVLSTNTGLLHTVSFSEAAATFTILNRMSAAGP